MIDSRSVGVKSPVTGKGPGVAEGVILGVAEEVAVDVGFGVSVGVGLTEAFGVGDEMDVGVGLGVLPEGEDTNAGTSPA